MLAVASSRIKILLFFNIARAKQTSWRCPELKLAPPSETLVSSPPERLLTTCFNSTWNYPELIKFQSWQNFFNYFFQRLPKLIIRPLTQRIKIVPQTSNKHDWILWYYWNFLSEGVKSQQADVHVIHLNNTLGDRQLENRLCDAAFPSASSTNDSNFLLWMRWEIKLLSENNLK